MAAELVLGSCAAVYKLPLSRAISKSCGESRDFKPVEVCVPDFWLVELIASRFDFGEAPERILV